MRRRKRMCLVYISFQDIHYNPVQREREGLKQQDQSQLTIVFVFSFHFVPHIFYILILPLQILLLVS